MGDTNNNNQKEEQNMTKFKRLWSLLLVVVLSASMFAGCNGNSGTTNAVAEMTPMNTTDEITLTYAYWEDQVIQGPLEERFHELYPNITIEDVYFESASGYTTELSNMAAASNLPDVFWVLSAEQAIRNGWLADITNLWESDDEAMNETIPSINEFKLGYLYTGRKFTTPVKYFPSVAFANKALWDSKNMEMPDVDMSWETFEAEVEKFYGQLDDNGKPLYGVSESCTVITWYPVANDATCEGEFGWDGTEFNMESWAYGVNLETKWTNGATVDDPDSWKTAYKSSNNIDVDSAIYEQDSYWAQDHGKVAFRMDQWWCWDRYWDKDWMIEENGVVWVPYVMPHTEANKDSTRMMATIDFGGISAACQYKREAYEWLKYSTWGADGWKAKLEIYPTAYTADGTLFDKNNCPITTNQEVWDGFRAWHPGDDDELGRGKWFDYCIPYFQNALAIPYGAQQIPGFEAFLEESGYREKETEIIASNIQNANDYVEEFEAIGKENVDKALQEVKDLYGLE
jgi:multiple sugar transport system substrate-binding protein